MNDTQKMLKSEIDTIVENINLTNSMIDAADPRDASDSIDIVMSLVDTLKTSESQLIETITNVDQSDLVDYAIKVNDDRQETIRRFKKLQKGQQPGRFNSTYQNNNFTHPPEEEVKLEMDSEIDSETPSKSHKKEKK